MLNPSQEVALQGILQFISTPIHTYQDCTTIIVGIAGSGKSFLTRHIADKIRQKYKIAGVAPTHKARKVLDKFLNKQNEKSLFANIYTPVTTIKTMTVASLLNKMRSHHYIGVDHYTGSGSKMNMFDVFIIDEASMINDEDIKSMINYAFNYKRKMIFIGDKYQIPNPTQAYVIQDGFAYKGDSIIFNIQGYELTNNMRQQEDNPIVSIYLEIKDAIDEIREANIPRINTSGTEFFTDKEKWYEKMLEIFQNSESQNSTELNQKSQIGKIRILCYTNDCVKANNIKIRKLLNKGDEPEVGDLLMGYTNVGYPEFYVNNGQDYTILSINKTIAYRILTFTNLYGKIITTKECDSNIQAQLFVPDISNPKNVQILEELVKRAEKVNRNYSTKNDYRKYSEIRNRLIFMENIYKFNNEIIGESQFRNTHPLLFKNMNEVINNRMILENKLSSDIREKYGNILDERVNDDKIFNDSEKICGKFLIIEKDIDYGYSVTAHKSQGSTYETVFIDEADFDKLRDHYNYRLGCDIKAVKEKNQLKYVSYTRPTTKAYVFYQEIAQ